MKTAISLPDATFERATRKSRELGISRSEFFARAAEVYLDKLASHSLTREIDEALETAGSDESSSAAVTAGRRRLAEDDW
jgi:metal-responsive CopG/Arc/MetJ family transcriptional regulator